MWLKEEDFKETVRNWWQGVLMEGAASFILLEKLKVLKGLLINWNMVASVSCFHSRKGVDVDCKL